MRVVCPVTQASHNDGTCGLMGEVGPAFSLGMYAFWAWGSLPLARSCHPLGTSLLNSGSRESSTPLTELSALGVLIALSA